MHHPTERQTQLGGFTLIELLVVISIIAMLLAVLLPSLKQSREVAKSALCLGNQRSIAQLTATYAEDYRQYVPTSLEATPDDVPATWFAKLAFYYLGVEKSPSPNIYHPDHRWGTGAGPERVFVCPSAPELGRTGLNHRWQIGYGWNFMALTHLDGTNLNNSGNTARMSQVQVPSQTILTGDSDDAWAQAYVIKPYYSAGRYNDAYPPIYRHMDKCNFSFLDGHATPLKKANTFYHEAHLWTLTKYTVSWDVDSGPYGP